MCGAEFTFGSHDGDSSAVIAIPPKVLQTLRKLRCKCGALTPGLSSQTAPGCSFRESISLGSTSMSHAEIRQSHACAVIYAQQCFAVLVLTRG